MVRLYREPVEGAPVTREHTRPVFVVDSLEDLRGPASGIVRLPIRLDWSPAPAYDLNSPQRVRTMYATVLREAGSEGDIEEYVNVELLRSVWSELRLPQFVRASWERLHPELLR